MSHPTTTPKFFPRTRLTLACLLGGAAIALAAGGCHKPPPVVQQSGPLPVNSFMRVWGSALELPKQDAISSLHVRDNTIYVYSKSGQVNGLSRDTGVLQFTYHVKNGGSDMRPPIVLKDSIVYPTLMTLEVRRSNGAALELYRAFDYRAVGVRPNYYVDEGEDAIVMVKELRKR